MKILHVLQSRYGLPPKKYGGTERVVWSLAINQQKAGHEVRYLWGNAKNLPNNAKIASKKQSIQSQIDDWPDIVHFHRPFNGELHKPYICTEHGNAQKPSVYARNTVFLSRKHADNHGADCFVYNGLDWDEYGTPAFDKPRSYAIFLGKCNAPHKNMMGAINVAKVSKKQIWVLGGNRLNPKRKPPLIMSRHVKFCGMVGGETKNNIIKHAQALVFPVRWHEPFGLAVIESLYLGVPVIATPFGSLPEIINEPRVGLLSDSYATLSASLNDLSHCDRTACHELARDKFSGLQMHIAYQQCYEQVLDGTPLNRGEPKCDGGLHDLLDIKD